MGPGGAPKGRPKWAPTRLSPKCALYGIYQFVSMHTLHLQHSLGEQTLMGPPGAPWSPKGTPNGVPTRLSPKCALYGINQFVSMHTLHLQHSLGEPILMGLLGPREPQRAPQMGRSPDFHRGSGFPKGRPSSGIYSTSVLVTIGKFPKAS